jgi:hypothetical protein
VTALTEALWTPAGILDLIISPAGTIRPGCDDLAERVFTVHILYPDILVKTS